METKSIETQLADVMDRIATLSESLFSTTTEIKLTRAMIDCLVELDECAVHLRELIATKQGE